MEEPTQSTEPDIPTTSTIPETKPNRHLGLIIILIILGLAIAALIYVTMKPAPSLDLRGSTSAGTDNQSLTDGYNNVTDQLNQNDSDLDTGNAALNDQQPTITGY